MIGFAALVACQAAPRATVGAATVATHEFAPPLAPLEYVPAAGLRWLVVADPAKIFADHELSAKVFELVPPDRCDAFASTTGIDPRRLEAVAIAGYDLGTLYVTALPAPDAGLARRAFEERLSNGSIVKHPRPELYRIAGTRDGAPRALVSVNDQLLAFAVGDLTLARIAEAYAQRHLKSPTALRGASLSTLPREDDALVVFYAPGPFTGAWARAAAGLLAEALALKVAVLRSEGSTLHFEITAVGDWPDEKTDARMAAAWTELASSSTGRLFGLDQAKNLKIVAHLHELTCSADLQLSSLVAGLRAATMANVPEMFDVHGPAPTDPPDKHQPAIEPPADPP